MCVHVLVGRNVCFQFLYGKGSISSRDYNLCDKDNIVGHSANFEGGQVMAASQIQNFSFVCGGVPKKYTAL